MAKPKKIEPKVELEREYIVPLRKGWLKVPEYKRANKALKTLKEFIAKHMKIYDRDLRKIKVDNLLNNEIRFKGMRKPLSKIKVKAKRFDDGIVRVELVNIPTHVKFEKLREEKKKTELEKKTKAKAVAQPVEKPESVEEKTEESEETKEKEQASKEESMKYSEKQTKEMKSISTEKQSSKGVETMKKGSLSR
tara:strand:- start:828 stop:1406 length:579 start_codon:yes stop_codon:yes gene_type:complete